MIGRESNPERQDPQIRDLSWDAEKTGHTLLTKKDSEMSGNE